MTNTAAFRFSGEPGAFTKGTAECGEALAIWRARRGPPVPAQSPAPKRTPSRPPSTTIETTAKQIYADARRLYQEGQYAQARMKLLRLVGGSVLADEGHYGLACIAERSGDLVTARSHLLRAVALNPRHRHAVTELARIDGAAPPSGRAPLRSGRE